MLKMHRIKTARDAVDTLDELRRGQGISQLQISLIANTPDYGQQYARMYGSGDVKLSKFLRFLRAVGCDLVIVQREGGRDE